MMGDRAMMSAYYPKSGQRPEDNVRAIADALAVYLAWSFRNSITQVKKTTTNTADASTSPINSASAPVTTLHEDLSSADAVIDAGSSGESLVTSAAIATAAEPVETGRPAGAPEATIEPIVRGQLRCQSVNLKRIAQRRRSKLRAR